MGPRQSNTNDGKLYEESDYTVIQDQVKDLRYGEIKLLRNNDSNILIFEQKIQYSTLRKDLNHNGLVQLINFTAQKMDELCGTFWKISYLYEYINHDLKKNIDDRSKLKQKYTEGELWYILKQCISALKYLKAKDITHGDIRPETILISPDGFIKLSENFIHLTNLTGYQQLSMQLRDDIYLSPALWERLQQKDPQPKCDFTKNDIFCLGLSVLEATIFQSTKQCYDDHEFKQYVLTGLLEEVPKYYSTRLYQFLYAMLQVNDDLRPDLDALNSELEKLQGDTWWASQLPDRLNSTQQILTQSLENNLQNPNQSNNNLDDKLQQLSPKKQQSQGNSPTRVPQQKKVSPVQQNLDKQFQQQQQQQQQKQQSPTLANNQNQSPSQVQNLQPQFQPIQQQQPQNNYGRFDFNQNFTQQQPPRAVFPPVSQDFYQLNVDPSYQQYKVVQNQDGKSLDDLDARINAVLAMSRETVIKYGGPKAIETYNRFDKKDQPDFQKYAQSQYYVPSQINNNLTNVYSNQQYSQVPLRDNTNPTSVSNQQTSSQQPISTLPQYTTTPYYSSIADNYRIDYQPQVNYYGGYTGANQLTQQFQSNQQQKQQSPSLNQNDNYQSQFNNQISDDQQQSNIANQLIGLSQQQQQNPTSHNSDNYNQEYDLDEQIKRSLERSRQVEEMIKSTRKAILDEQQ